MSESYLTFISGSIYFAPAAPLDAPPMTDWARFLAWSWLYRERPVDRARRERVERAMRARARRAQRHRRVLR